MTAYLAGMTHRRLAEHPRAAEITGAMRGVLAVMSYPAQDARSQCSDAERYVCTLAWATIARESGYGRDYLRQELGEQMAALGLIERIGEPAPRKRTHWRLMFHLAAERARLAASDPQSANLGVSDPQSAGESWGPQTPSLGVSDPQPGGVRPPNPSESCVAPAEQDDDDRAAGAAPSAGATGSAVATTDEQTGELRTSTIAEVAKRRACPATEARSWALARLAGRTPEDPDAYVLGALDKHREAPAAGAAKSHAAKSTATTAKSTTAPARSHQGEAGRRPASPAKKRPAAKAITPAAKAKAAKATERVLTEVFRLTGHRGPDGRAFAKRHKLLALPTSASAKEIRSAVSAAHIADWNARKAGTR